jgi:hypothetical protein
MDPVTRWLLKQSKRSWWQCDYSNGSTLSEWDTLTGKALTPGPSGGQTSRWEQIPKEKMIRLRLFCPDGQLGQLDNPEGRRFFQLKVGGFMIGSGQYTVAHIIGVVTDDAGNCTCFAWENQKITSEDKLVNATVAKTYLLEKNKYFKIDVRDAGMDNGNCWVHITTQLRPQGLVSFQDNVLNMKYENLGNLNIDVQRLNI